MSRRLPLALLAVVVVAVFTAAALRPAQANTVGEVVNVDYCNLQFPVSFTAAAGSTSPVIYGRIYEDDDGVLTSNPGAHPSVVGQIGHGPLGSDPRSNNPSWRWLPATYNVQVGNDDEYQATFTVPFAPANTQLSYTYRFSVDGGTNFTYCDANGNGTNGGLSFSTANLGTLTISPGGTPTLSINDVAQNEGDSGTTNFVFTVSLNGPSTAAVTFDIATANNTATVANNDFVANSATGLSIPVGQTSTTFTVVVNGDTAFEPNETFFVNLTNIVGATAGDAQGQGVILNDDADPCASIAFPYMLTGNTPAELIQAIACANANGASADVINLNGQTVTLTDAFGSFDGATGLPQIATNITVRNGAITRSGTNQFRFFNVSAAGTLTLGDMTLTNGGGATYAANGGLIYAATGSNLAVVNSTLSGGAVSSSFNAGGVLASGAFTLANSTISGNTAGRGGGLVVQNGPALITNSVISGNVATSSLGGGAIYVPSMGLNALTIANSTITGNYATATGATRPGGILGDIAGPNLVLRNSIVWGNSNNGNTAPQVVNDSGTNTATNSIVQGGQFGALNSDPLFITPITASATPSTAGNFQLSNGSPAIDAGANADVPADTFDLNGNSNTTESAPDRAGNPRRYDDTGVADTGTGTAPIVDLGAYERQTNSAALPAGVTLDQKLTSADFTIDAPANEPDLAFGQAVAVAGNWMAVGAPSDNDGIGRVYIYERVSGTWLYRTRLNPPSPQAGAQFGAAVDIYEAGGLLTVIVGEPLRDEANADQGRAVIFSDTNAAASFSFTTTTITSPTPEADGRFGASVALFADDAAIGSPTNGTTDDGLVSIRGRNVGGTNAWGQVGATKAGQPGSAFGTAVDLHGEYLIVGAPLNEDGSAVRTGAAYVYRQDLGGANAWGLRHTLSPAFSQSDAGFGQSVGIWDSNLGAADSASRSIVGAPLYDNAGTVDAGLVNFFTDTTSSGQFIGPNANSQYGFSVALEGADAIASRPTQTVAGQANTGQVNTFSFNGATWVTNTINLTQTGAQANYFYGYAVDLSGTVAVIGAPGSREDALALPPGAIRAGRIETLDKPGPTWAKDTDSTVIATVDLPNTAPDQQFGSSIDATDTWLVVGVPNDNLNGTSAGAVYVYRNVSGVWTPHSRLTPLDKTLLDAFGSSVAVSGNRIVVGAPLADGFPTTVSNSGAFYVYEFNGSSWREQGQVNSPDPAANGRFGISLDLDGNVLVVGAPGENGNRGRAYAYRDLITFTNPITLDIPAAGVGSETGRAVTVYDPAPGTPNNEVIAIGAYDENSSQGAAYVLSGSTFATISTLVDPAPGPDQFFGYAVSIHSGRVAVGAPTEEIAPSGRVVVFSGSGYTTADTLTRPTGAGQFGFAVHLSGASLAVGAPATAGLTGSAYVFSFNAGTWAERGRLDPTDLSVNDRYGTSVTQSGSQHLVGAPFHNANGISDSGAAYAFSLAPEVILTPSTLAVAEAGPTSDTFTVALTQAPATNVTIQLTFDSAQVQVDTGSGFGASPQTVTLTPANAVSGVTVTVRAVDDAVTEADPHTITITTGATSSATPSFNGLAVEDVTVEIADNDTPGVSITQTGGSIAVSESGTTDTYTLVLDSQPATTVNVAISFPASDVTVNGDTDGTFNTTFTTANWNTPQTITVAAVNDRNFEAAHAAALGHAFTSADAGYNGITARVDGATDTNTVSASITDNETVELRWQNAASSSAEGAFFIQNVIMDITADPAGGTPQNEVGLGFEAPLVFAGTAEAADVQVLFISQTISPGNADGELFTVFHQLVDDALVEGPETFTLGINVTTPYSGLAAGPDHVATITDSDTATITLSGGATVAEAAGAAPLTVTLATSGGATLENDLTVPVNLSDSTASFAGGDFAFAGPSNTANVTFPAGSAGGTRTVNVAIAEDVLVEGTESFSAAFGTLTGVATAAGTAQTITITDNETATISFAAAASDAAEAATPHLVQTVLEITAVGTGTPELQNAVNVAVTQTPGTAATPADYTVATASLSFPAGSADGTTRAISSSIAADAIDEADETFTLGLGAVTGPASAADSHTVTIRDDDTAGVLVTQSGGGTGVTEGGATDSYTVVLTSEPTANVTINIAFNPAQIIVNGDTDGTTSLTFIPAEWDTPQTLPVAAVDDTIFEANPHSTLITQTASSADPLYNSVNPADVTVSIAENDFQAITFALAAGSVAETAGDYTVNARLSLITNGTPGGTISAAMSATVNVTLGNAGAGDATLTTTSVTFPAGSTHNSTQPISIAIANDRLLEGDETLTLGFTLTTPTGTASGTHEVTITDDEIGIFSFTLAANDTGEAAGTYTSEARLTITGSGDGTTFRIQDAASIGLTATPGTAATPADYSLSTTTLSIPANAPSPLDIAFDAAIVNDRLFEGNETFTLGFGAITGSGALSGSGTHTVTITDDEGVDITLAPATAAVAETAGTHSSTATLTITGTGAGPAALTSAITVPVNSTPGTAATPADFTPGTASITFAAGALSGATQAIIVGVIDDAIDEDDETFSVALDTSSAAPGVTFGNAETVMTITDDDTASVVVTQSGGATAVVEGGATDSYTVVLASQPTANVSVNLVFDPTQLTLNGDTDGALGLTFTPATWDSAQAVSVSAVDDTVVEGDHTSAILQGAVSADPRYNGIDTPNMGVDLNDNDTAEVIFSSAGFTAIEGATFSPGMTLKVTANGAPGGSIAAPVVVDLGLTLGTAGAGDVSVTTPQATFPAGSAHDTVVVTHVLAVTDDRAVERSEDFTLTLSIASGAATTTASNTYTISSDDTAAVSYSTAASTAPENASPHSVTARLTISGTGTGPASIAEPLAVAISQAAGTATTPADYSLTTASITFAAGSLDAATAAIAIAIVNDALIESNHSFTLGFGAVTSDLPAVSASGAHTVTIADDDVAGVTIGASGGATSVVEGGASDTVTIALGAEPTSDVTISFAVGTQVTVAPASLLFTPADWSVPQTITVAAVDDATVEGAHSATVGLSFAGDADFAVLAPNAVTIAVAITDNDSAPTTTPTPTATPTTTPTPTATPTTTPTPTSTPGVPTTRSVYLPLVSAASEVTDLVVEQISTEGGQLSIVIANQGSTPITTPFWVDLLIAPARVPQAPNDTWEALGSRGVVWGITAPLAPGERITLRLNDRFYRGDQSTFGQAITIGTPLYAHVDSANANTLYGAVFESHERDGQAYNNIRATTAASTIAPPATPSRRPLDPNLSPRGHPFTTMPWNSE